MADNAHTLPSEEDNVFVELLFVHFDGLLLQDHELLLCLLPHQNSVVCVVSFREITIETSFVIFDISQVDFLVLFEVCGDSAVQEIDDLCHRYFSVQREEALLLICIQWRVD